MNLDIILRKLYLERKKLDEIIASLEQLRRSTAVAEESGKKVRKNAGRAGKKKNK
jgi:hypothetical protein